MADKTQVQTSTKPASSNARPLLLQRQCACGTHSGGGECEGCKAKKGQLQRAAVSTEPAGTVPPLVQTVLNSAGRPLDTSTRSLMEARFGHDFSGVRIHTDPQAAQSAQAVNALAYTVGSSIVFGTEQYRPQTKAGQRLLAHELTHVVQQKAGLAGIGISHPQDAAEQEAERNANLLYSPQPLTFRQSASPLARQSGTTTVTVQAPSGPNDCSLADSNLIIPAVYQSLNWLSQSVSSLNNYISAPAAASNATTRTALERHFHSSSVGTARHVRDRLETIRTDITNRNPFTTECHTAADPECATSGAYVPGDNHSKVVFCPTFLNPSTSVTWRSETLIHEMSHALLGGPRITDRGYASDRVLPFLSTAEALTNAESYALFAQQLGTGSVPASSAPTDILNGCTPETTALLQVAIARAQRWNRNAEVVVGDQRPSMIQNYTNLQNQYLGGSAPANRANALTIFRQLLTRLQSAVNVQCDAPGSAGGGGLAYASGTTLHIGPSWKDQPTEATRIETVLAGLYQTYAGLNAAQSLNHARFARAITERYFGLESGSHTGTGILAGLGIGAAIGGIIGLVAGGPFGALVGGLIGAGIGALVGGIIGSRV